MDAQSDAAPFKKPAFAGDKILDRMDDTLIVAWPEPEITEMKPEFMPAARLAGNALHVKASTVHRRVDILDQKAPGSGPSR